MKNNTYAYSVSVLNYHIEKTISMFYANNIAFVPTYLYIKRHSITGKRYFGMTTKQGKEFDNYKGSGKMWVSHINNYGKEFVKNSWYRLFTSVEELIVFALTFSYKHNIGIDSNHKSKFMNLIVENGINSICTRIGKKQAVENGHKINEQTGLSKHQERSKKMAEKRSMINIDTGLTFYQESARRGVITKSKINEKTGLSTHQEVGLRNSSWMNEIDEKTGISFSKLKALKMIETKSKVNEKTGLTLFEEGGIKAAKTRAENETDNKGSRNPNALKIDIYDSSNNLVIQCHGSFKKECNNLGISVNKLGKSLRGGGKPIKDEIFDGWYALYN